LAKRKYAEVASKIDEFTHAISVVIQELVSQVKALKARGISVEEFSEKFGQETNLIFMEFKEKFGEEWPEDRTERYKELERAIDWTLDKVEEALVTVLVTLVSRNLGSESSSASLNQKSSMPRC